MSNEFYGVYTIFDNDGIIVDTEPGHFWARREALLQLGIELTKEQYIRDGISRGHREFLGNVVPPEKLLPVDYDRFFQAEIQRRYHAWRKRHLSLVDGFSCLLEWLTKEGIPVAVASTQPRDTVLGGLKMMLGERKYKLFRAIVSGEEVKRNKPAPDVYLEAARQLGAEPKNCVAVEDSVSGVTSAKAAGMICVARRNDWARDADLLTASADALCEPDYSNWAMLCRIVL